MDDLIAELERLHREADKSMSGTAWAMAFLIHNLPRLLATLKAAEGMREGLNDVAVNHLGENARCELCGEEATFPKAVQHAPTCAIRAYDAAKGE